MMKIVILLVSLQMGERRVSKRRKYLLLTQDKNTGPSQSRDRKGLSRGLEGCMSVVKAHSHPFQLLGKPQKIKS